MYTNINFRSKKALKEAVKAWLTYTKHGGPTRNPITYYQPGPFSGNEPKDGTICVEGPHYPEPHRWYASCTVKDGVIVAVK